MHWADKYWTPGNLCAGCGHPRDSHLGEAPLRGEPKEDDSGWCTKPAGTCIFNPCSCTQFIEPLTVSVQMPGVPVGSKIMKDGREIGEVLDSKSDGSVLVAITDRHAAEDSTNGHLRSFSMGASQAPESQPSSE